MIIHVLPEDIAGAIPRASNVCPIANAVVRQQLAAGIDIKSVEIKKTGDVQCAGDWVMIIIRTATYEEKYEAFGDVLNKMQAFDAGKGMQPFSFESRFFLKSRR